MIRKPLRYKGILSAVTIPGVEIVGMPVEPQLLVSYRVILGFLGGQYVTSPPPPFLQTPPGVHPGPIL